MVTERLNFKKIKKQQQLYKMIILYSVDMHCFTCLITTLWDTSYNYPLGRRVDGDTERLRCLGWGRAEYISL